MASGLELDRFLGELTTRRLRILALAGPSGPQAEDLLDELRELGEQLVVADEELRVQQEELDAAHGELLSLSAERDLLLRHSTRAYVVTDVSGVVLQSTRTAQQLVRQPQSRLVPRPIASWFVVADRRAVRSMVARARTGAEPERSTGLRLQLPDEGTRLVDVVVAAVAGVEEGTFLLRWELLPVAPLRAVPDAEEAERHVGEDEASALAWAEAVAALLACGSAEEVVERVVGAAARLVPGAGRAEVVLGNVDAPGGTGDGSGSSELIVVPVETGGQRFGVLTVHARGRGGFVPDAEACAAALALHAGCALRRLTEVQNLRAAAGARQLVGQAVGILVERHRIEPDAAFARLVRWSQESHVKLRHVAAALVETGQEPPPRHRP